MSPPEAYAEALTLARQAIDGLWDRTIENEDALRDALGGLATFLEATSAPEAERVRQLLRGLEGPEPGVAQPEEADVTLWNRMKQRFSDDPAGDDPLVLRDHIFRTVERLLTPLDRLKNPNIAGVDVLLLPPDADARTAWGAYFVEGEEQHQLPALARYLSDAGFKRLAGIQARFVLLDAPPESLSELERTQLVERRYLVRPTAAERRPQHAGAVLTLEGETDVQFELRPADRFINIGRLHSVSRPEGGVRYNALAFEGSDPTFAEVSRAHASIRFETEQGTFQIRDDGSRFGTAILRGPYQNTIPVRRHYRTLEDGDVIQLGTNVKLRFERS
ncbi:MAG: FHA domain-containing protein [Bacteroidota bacterium]